MILLFDLTKGKAIYPFLEELIFASIKFECFRVIDLYLAPANDMTLETIMSTVRIDSTYLHISVIDNPGIGYTAYYEFYISDKFHAIKCNVIAVRAEELLRKYKIVLTN